MGFFKRRKKRKNIEEFVEENLSRESLNGQKYQAEHEALNCCEQLMNASKELEETRKDYRLITDYLNDIQTIEGLPPEEMDKIQETARNIVSLSQIREGYSNKKKRLSDVQFMQMDQLAEEIPDDIRRLQANEGYQSMIKHDMDCLEGEKSEWGYYLEAITREQKVLKAGLWVLLAVVLAGICGLEYYQYSQHRDMSVFVLGFLLVVAVCGSACILRLENDKKEQKRAQASINRAITISNQMKAKYVNVTNAVDYACEKFHVRNSMELNYLWEQYMEAVREQEAVVKTNEDLEYFNKKLVRELKRYQLYDAAIWMHQANAIVDKKEMVEVKHYLLVRRQKLRSRMEQQITEIQDAKKQMLLLVKSNPEYKKEIMDVLQSIDQMCGV